jgi:fructan beta-fructosidase
VLDGNSFDGLSISLGNGTDEVVLIDFSGSVVSIDRSKSGLVGFEKGFAASHSGKLPNGTRPASLRIFVDTSSIEVFVNEGELVMTEVVFPTQPYDKLVVNWQGGAVVKNVAVSQVEAIW